MYDMNRLKPEELMKDIEAFAEQERNLLAQAQECNARANQASGARQILIQILEKAKTDTDPPLEVVDNVQETVPTE